MMCPKVLKTSVQLPTEINGLASIRYRSSAKA